MKQIIIKVQTRKLFNNILSIIEDESIWSDEEKLRVCIKCKDGEYIRFFADSKKTHKYLSDFMTQDAKDSFVVERQVKGTSGVVWHDWYTGKPQIYKECLV